MRVSYWLLSFVLLTGLWPVLGQTVLLDDDARLVEAPPFILSEKATAAGLDGKMIVDLTVDKSGVVKNVEIVAGPAWPCGTNPKKEIKELTAAVKENLRQSRFSPTIRNGKAISSDVRLTFVIGKAYRAAMKERDLQEAIRRGGPVPRFVDAGILNGRALTLAKPSFPPGAKVLDIGGTSQVEIVIGEDGKVSSAGVVSGNSVFHDEARDAACASKFSPTLLKGQPIKVSGVITYNFVQPLVKKVR